MDDNNQKKNTGSTEINTDFRDILILTYTLIIAFFLGIAGSIIAKAIPSSPPIVPTTAIVLLILISQFLINQISRFLRADKPRESKDEEKLQIECPFEVSMRLFEDIKKDEGYYPILGFQTSGWIKLLFLPGYVHSAMLIVVFFILSYIKSSFWSLFLSIILILYCVWFVNLGNIKDRIQLRTASKFKVKTYFLIEGEGFLNPKRYYVVIDFNEKKSFFARYSKDEDLEKRYKVRITKMSNSIAIDKRESLLKKGKD